MFYFRKIRLTNAGGSVRNGFIVVASDQDTAHVFTAAEGLKLLGHISRGTSIDTVARMINAGEFSAFCGETAAIETASHLMESASIAQVRMTCSSMLTAEQQSATAQAEQTRPADMSGILIKSGYTQNYTYSGFGSYHGNQDSSGRSRFNVPVSPDSNRPWRIGVELEVYAKNEEAKQKICNGRTNWFQCERDGSLTDTVNGTCGLGIELKTIPLRACDAKNPEFWREPMARLRELAVSKEFTTTGLHVHIGKEIFGTTQAQIDRGIANLNFFYVHMIVDNPEANAVNVAVCGRAHGYRDSQYPLAGAKSDTVENLKRLAKDGNIRPFIENLSESALCEIRADLNAKCGRRRWDINITNLNTYGTVEFRKGDGRISGTRIAALAGWWESMILYTRDTPWAEMSFENFLAKAKAENPALHAILDIETEG